MRDHNIKLLMPSIVFISSLGMAKFASLSPARPINADVYVEPRPILSIKVSKEGTYYSDDAANVFFINNQGKKARIFKYPGETKTTLSSVEPSAGKLFLFGPQDVRGFNISNGRKAFETRGEQRGYIISFHPMGNSRFILGVGGPSAGETLKIIDHRGRLWNVPKCSYKFRSTFYDETFVSSDRDGRLISVWDDANGLGVLNPLNGRRKFCYSNRQLSTYLSLPQNHLSISSMAFMKNRLLVCEYRTGKILSVNLKNPKEFKVIGTNLKSVMFMTKSQDENNVAVADFQGKVKILRVFDGKLKPVKGISLKSRATAMAWNARSNGIIIGQENGSLFWSAVPSH